MAKDGTAHERNRLGDAPSPYLRQHGDNPVPWQPWEPEVLETARRLDRPLFLSVGYSTCHWCHVMAHESFEDDEVARLLGRSFVSVKVDREERPDVDAVCMAACQILNGSGGWPLTVFATPDGRPFFAATYLPRDDRGGRMGFVTLLERVAAAWRDDRAALLDGAEELAGAIRRSLAARTGPLPEADLPRRCAAELLAGHDRLRGGFGRRPKFPLPSHLLLLLRAGGVEGVEAARRSLRAMARGGIFDHVGGGLHRYATDRRWLLPHFEKMLSDQALVAMVAVETWERTGDPELSAFARSLLDYALDRLASPDGAFFTAEDADSEGEEGRFYVWRRAELISLLGEADGDEICRLMGVEERGNFDPEDGAPRRGDNVLHRPGDLDETPSVEADALWARARPLLAAARARRVRPGRDEKILLDLNGLAVAALARCGRILGEARFVEAAARAAASCRDHLRREGRWFHRRAGDAVGIDAFLDDHAFFAWGLFELWTARGEAEDLEDGRALVEALLSRFRDAESGGFWMTPHDGEPLVARPEPAVDGALPSGNAVAVDLLFRLAAATGETRYRSVALETLRAFGSSLRDDPGAHVHMLAALPDGVLRGTVPDVK